MSSNVDAVVVGAGLAGAVMAERLASCGKRVLLIEQRDHVGGNCHDSRDEAGLFIQHYGPHLFHTDNRRVFDYLSRFTEWFDYQHHVLAAIGEKRVPLPFNLNSIEQCFDPDVAAAITDALHRHYGDGGRVPILELRKSGDAQLQLLADYVYENVFRHYSEKQWGIDPQTLDEKVLARVPVEVSRDDRYFRDPIQMMPVDGFSAMIERMVDHPNINLALNTDYSERLRLDGESSGACLDDKPFSGPLIYTGPIDHLFDYRFGELPYRTLKLEFERLEQEQYQPATVVNHPNAEALTRITEFKWINQAQAPYTIILREYPDTYDRNSPGYDIPYYPLFTPEAREEYRRYRDLAKQFEQLHCVGRLAEYRYYDMDDVVARALHVSSLLGC